MSMCGSCPISKEDALIDVYEQDCRGNAGSESCVYALISHASSLSYQLGSNDEIDVPLVRTLIKYPELREFEELAPFGKVARKALKDEDFNKLWACRNLPPIILEFMSIVVCSSNGILIVATRSRDGDGPPLKRLDQTLILRRMPE